MKAELQQLIDAEVQVMERALVEDFARFDNRVHLRSVAEAAYQLGQAEGQAELDDVKGPQFTRRIESVTQVFRERADAYRVALESIANSSCCTGCQEAALVAKAALRALPDPPKETP